MDDEKVMGTANVPSGTLAVRSFWRVGCAYHTWPVLRHRDAKIMKTHRKSDLFRRLMSTAAIVLLAVVITAAAQESRREVVKHSPTPADDAKPNSDRVPDVYALSGKFERVLVFRYKYETDLL